MKLSRRSFLRYAAWGAGALALAACAPQSAEPQPPEIAYNHDTCDNCGMLISEVRFACASLLIKGGYRKFDDIGCLAAYHTDRPNEQAAAYFVHDYHSESWIRGESATYVHSPKIASPMGHGLAAFGTREAAEGFAKSYCGDTDCDLLNFDEMRVHVHMHVHG
ncbi:MAG: nitrous oxide reductase accessory protein NosL [Anaerolineales bacterium]|nr:nitrous oxide reductase accessory protein NosL [Anaerolineales bacterium]